MKIALICPYHMFRGGGVQECVTALRQEYAARGHDAKIITPMPRDYEGEVPEHIITLGTSMSTTAFAGSAWQWSFSVDNDAIDEVFQREQFDVLHFHEPWIPFWSRQLLGRANMATVGTQHGRFWETLTAKTVTTVVTPYVKSMVKHFDVFTAVSEPATDWFRAVTHRPIIIVPNGIDLAKFQVYTPKPKGKKSNTKTIFYVGRLENRKGVKYLLQAFHDLTKKRKDVRLVIAGSGVDDKKLKEFVADQSIPRVEFLGFISEEDKVRYLHESDLFCSPAVYGESFGIVLLEAMAAGLPLVAGDNAGYQSTLIDTGAISLVNPKDTVDFARRLEIMMFDEKIRQIWREWALNYVKQFDYPIVAEQYLAIYEQAIKRHEEHAKA
ncbi:MAG TPA: glycosyltransferase family 4 protein [Candidatus Saccharimonadales bacterium]|nr:glycosyltransferase family 4 protein [Candidatus Saccharimonadales bacterium]